MLKLTCKFPVDYLGSHPPTGQTMSDKVTENNLELRPVRHHGCLCYEFNLTSVAMRFKATVDLQGCHP